MDSRHGASYDTRGKADRTEGSLPPYWIRPIALQRPAAPPGHGAEAQAQRVQLDEALGINLVIRALVVLERHHLHRIQAVRAFPSDAGDVALVQLQPNP